MQKKNSKMESTGGYTGKVRNFVYGEYFGLKLHYDEIKTVHRALELAIKYDRKHMDKYQHQLNIHFYL